MGLTYRLLALPTVQTLTPQYEQFATYGHYISKDLSGSFNVTHAATWEPHFAGSLMLPK